MIILLQLLSGFSSALSWIGAQTLFGRIMLGHPEYAGPFAFSLRMGSFVGPPAGGLAFDLWGVWGGFAVLALWAAGTVACAWFLPPSRSLPAGRARVEIADLMPRTSDYVAAFKLARCRRWGRC